MRDDLKNLLKNKEAPLWHERLYLELSYTHISHKAAAEIIGVDLNVFNNKLNGLMPFTLDEATIIQKKICPGIPIEILFTLSPLVKYNPITDSYIVK